MLPWRGFFSVSYHNVVFPLTIYRLNTHFPLALKQRTLQGRKGKSVISCWNVKLLWSLGISRFFSVLTYFIHLTLFLFRKLGESPEMCVDFLVPLWTTAATWNICELYEPSPPVRSQMSATINKKYWPWGPEECCIMSSFLKFFSMKKLWGTNLGYFGVHMCWAPQCHQKESTSVSRSLPVRAGGSGTELRKQKLSPKM